MKFKSQVYTQVSGSVGGLTYAHAKGGTMYSRARALPADPQTAFQLQVRGILAGLVNFWTDVLTSGQRNSWEQYAGNVPVTNALGDSILLSGQNWYIGANTPRAQAAVKLGTSLSPIADAPTVYNRGDLTPSSAIAYSEASGLSLAYDNADEWAINTGGALLVFQGRPRNQSRLAFKGPWRLVGAVAGDTTTPPTSPLTVTAANITALGFTITEDDFISTALVAVQADGRYTTRRIQPSVVAVA